jgi:hypothetical protein
MIQTKKMVGFIVEVYKLTHYWENNNGWRYTSARLEDGGFIKEKITHFFITPSCYKRTHYEKFNSIRKLNSALGLKKGKRYFFHKNLEDAIKGAYGYNFYSFKNCSDKIWIIRQLHDLDNRYSIR